jgi:levanase/fructan beta-fructosidase
MNDKMKKLMTTIVAAVLMATSAQAQVQPKVLGENHAMVRAKQGTKYLLLPVQEKEENAHIAVLDGRNEMVKRLNVRLAVDKVDYFVPLEIKQAQLLDITFQGDRRTTGAVKDFVCWKEIKYSDTFDTTNREKFRPAYHHTPLYGWMNDPNGMFYKGGVWHLYYQYNPYGSQWENMTWGHSTSKDLIHWEAQPLAIESDWLGAIFSGSCVTNGSDVVAFYTSAGQHQVQSMAVSKNGGLSFEKFSGNPVLTSDVPDFRDPKAFWNEDAKVWNLILAAGQEMRIYSSKDLKEWKYESSFGQEYGNHGGVWECPDLFKLIIDNGQLTKEKWVLLCNINPGGPFGGSATQYFVGDFDGKKFTCESMPKVTKWLDYGKDHYATVSFYNAPENRRVVLAWMSNWQYANQVPTKQFRSANSIPRDLGLFTYGEETYVSVVPSKEMLDVRGQKIKKPTESCEIVVDMKNSADIILSNTKGEEVTMHYDAQQQTFSMDRTKSGDVSFSEAFPCVTTAPTYGSIRQLRIFIDRCSIEAFDSDGKMAMTNLVFPSEPYNNIKVKGGKAVIYEVKSEK